MRTTHTRATQSLPTHDTWRDHQRLEILAIAQECFLAEGYTETSMNTIAARRGGSKSTLYQYFDSKRELFAAVIEQQCAGMTGALPDLPRPGDDLQGRLVRFAGDYLERLLTPQSRGLLRLVISESERFPELSQMYYELGPKIVAQRLEDYFGALVSHGFLRNVAPPVAARQFTDLVIFGPLLRSGLGGSAEGLSTTGIAGQISNAVNTFLRAFSPC